ncbi:GNAT family N-acetyltransferase [Mycobacterium talmoniae]|uniref:GNAT family N-acetyltransferase n=1 Tax=Mycobacterium talmoniae TaxID=1858794 RepID=UPI0009F492CA|nr:MULTISPECIES: GNAT family N-acetyltransferase [Mycobacterium]TDH51863.1 N-acetyltransferase [Mycobacterium eburneum]
MEGATHIFNRKRRGNITQPTVTTTPKQYEISVDGTRAGLAAYVDSGAQRIFYHTEIGDEFGDRGLGSQLTAAALDDTRAAGKRIVAICPFVAAYVDKHEDYDDILDPITPQAHAVVRQQLG